MKELNKITRELWWLYLLQGIVALMLGIVALFWPGLTLVVLLYTLAIYAMVIGVAEMVFGITSMRVNKNWWLVGLGGLAMVGIAAYLVRNPAVALGSFVIIVGAMFVVRGVFDVILAALGDSADDRVLSVVTGILGVIAGILVWVYPVSGTLSFVWVLGLFALIAGTVQIARAISLSRELN